MLARMYLTLLLSMFSPALAHMVEVSASKKECFFEDLHQHDKVRYLIIYPLQVSDITQSTDDSDLPSGRGRPSGYRLLGEI
jgi:hypothetical protein